MESFLAYQQKFSVHWHLRPDTDIVNRSSMQSGLEKPREDETMDV